MRNQFSHVIDLAPTVLEAAGLPEPTMVNGVHAEPVRGHQHALQLQRRQRAGAARDPVLRDVLQPRHLPQGLERGDQAPHAVGDGAARRCRRSTTTSGSSTTATRTGPRRKDLAKEMPEKLHELQRLWLIEAVKYNVLPLDDRQIERINSELAGRPVLIKGNLADCCSRAWDACPRTAWSTSRTSRSRSPPTSRCRRRAPRA